MSKNIILVLSAAVVAVLGIILWNAYSGDRIPVPSGSGATAGWQSFTASPFGSLSSLSVEYPPGADVSRPREGVVALKYLGVGNTAGSEITDGYLITIEGIATSSSPDAYAAGMHPTNAGIRTLEFNGYDARHYETQTALGTMAAHTVFSPSVSEIVDVSVSAFGPQAQGYRADIGNILATLRVGSAAQSGTGNAPPIYKSVKVALLDTEGATAGTKRGCDRVVFVSREVAPTQAPLTAALQELFSLTDTSVDGWYNFIAKTNGTLHFERATVAKGVASVYLTGSLSGLAGVCDDPRAAAQIKETALQFATVSQVDLYLNGQKTDLIPNEKGE